MAKRLLRMERSFDTSRSPRQARVVLRALKRSGALVADNGWPGRGASPGSSA